MRIGFAIAAAFLLTAGSAPPSGAAAEVTARLGKTFDVGTIKVTPLQVIEDSRCPGEAHCGTLRLRALVETPLGGHERTLIEGTPQMIAGGSLVLAEVTPKRSAAAIAAKDYRFVLRYSAE